MSKLFRLLTDTPMGGDPRIRTMTGLIISLTAALILAGVMMLVYRLSHDSLTCNRKFNVTLMMLALASDLLLTLIQNNPLFSLGALGALSICRIRTNTRDPRDLGFVFWALTIGISCSLGAFPVALAGTVVLSAVMLIFGRTAKKKDVLTMVVRGEKDRVGSVQEVFSHTPGSSIQSKNLFQDSFELVYELRVPESVEENLLLLLGGMEGVHGVNVLAPQTKVA
jgi:hypothetical protein